MYSNNILNFQESTTILNACKKKARNLLNASRIYKPIHTYRERYRKTGKNWERREKICLIDRYVDRQTDTSRIRIYNVCLRCLEFEIVFKTEMNNDGNVNFLQNRSLRILHLF